MSGRRRAEDGRVWSAGRRLESRRRTIVCRDSRKKVEPGGYCVEDKEAECGAEGRQMALKVKLERYLSQRTLEASM